MSRLLPLFPLQLVVFPRTQVPLHIFEERYKQMVGAAIREKSEFGIVLAKDQGIVNAGCTVAVDQVVTEYPDGRMDIVTTGKRRFEIVYVNQDEDYLQAEVDYFDDEAGEVVSEELRNRALKSYREMTDAEARSGSDSPAQPEPLASDEQLSFQLAQGLPDLNLQSMLLRSRSEVERLEGITRFLEHHIPRAREIARMRHLAPLNGFGHKIAGV